MEDFAPYGNLCYRYLGEKTYKIAKAKEMCASANAQLPDFSDETDWPGFVQAIEDSTTNNCH